MCLAAFKHNSLSSFHILLMKLRFAHVTRNPFGLEKRNTSLQVQSNLCTTNTIGTLNLWSLLTGGRCSEVALCNKSWKWDPKNGGRSRQVVAFREVVVSSGSTALYLLSQNSWPPPPHPWDHDVIYGRPHTWSTASYPKSGGGLLQHRLTVGKVWSTAFEFRFK